MSAKLRRLEISKCADDTLAELNISNLPVNPVEIARRKEITVQSWEPRKPGISGFLMKQGDAFGIGYSRFINNEGFIHFTVGHELGHYFIPGHVDKLFPDGTGIHQSQSGFLSHEVCEREADFFSATLLMPEMLFKKALRRSASGFAGLEALARLCATSLTATAIRFAELSDDPVAIIIGNEGRVGFSCMSPAIQAHPGLTWLKDGDDIPAASATARFQRDPENITASRRTEGVSMLDEWFEGAPRIEMKEDVIGLGPYGKSLTVLFTSEALEEEDSDDEDGGYLPSWKRGR